MRTAIALGSNIGDRRENLSAARQAILDLSIKPPILASPLYETEPVSCEPGAGKFLNAVIEFEYDGDPVSLLEQLMCIEQSLGRNRDHPRNISRTIDIDLLYCGDRQIHNQQLQLPHPRMHVRTFVLRPLADIRPDLVLPGQTQTVCELLKQLGHSRDVVAFATDW
jgi:2-amino-4-hydroxy-6-hydroxymethyldihydropteridine diphosphokinase